jgi:beta-lactamase regulating signal transducer with metallopeptidase domain
MYISSGFSRWGAIMQFGFHANNNQHSYDLSAGDMVIVWLSKHSISWVISVLSILFILRSASKLCQRIATWVRFERQRSAHRKYAISLPYLFEKKWLRPVDIYISPKEVGSPYSGGMWSPYICIPETTYLALEKQELLAVLHHEWAHIVYLDLPIRMVLGIFGDLFWFLPGLGYLQQQIAANQEWMADDFAHKQESDSFVLAKALYKVGELSLNASLSHSLSPLHLTEQPSLLYQRIANLTKQASFPPSRWFWNFRILRFLLTFWIAGTVYFLLIAGNVH